MHNEFDIIVIGVGMAGLNIARRCAASNKRVAVVDELPYGGTCALRGCDPKKVLVGAAEVVDWHRRMAGNGITGDTRIDWQDLMAFKRTFTEPVPDNIEDSLTKMGVETYHERAQFVDKNKLQVGQNILSAQHIVVATGAKPRPLDIPGEELIATSTDFLELKTLPERIIFIGGGYISFEFAHIAARAGAETTILHRGERPLEDFDPDLVSELMTASSAVEIDVKVNMEVIAIRQSEKGYIVHTDTNEQFECDLVIHGAGRVPAIDDLDLDKAGIEHTHHGIVVNEYLQSVSNPIVYAAGDT
ncbi:MAG: NAD(P)/FAD-dependent oxidoreductase, partial [Chloroflexota bacterium]